jgi:hypothetical protein
MPFYVTGAFGRAVCLAALAGLLWLAAELTGQVVVAVFFAVWTVYAFVGGIVAVPYNDIVARSVPSDQRRRLLAVRFFGGGLLAVLVAVCGAPDLGRSAVSCRIRRRALFRRDPAARLGAVLCVGWRTGGPRQDVRHTSELGVFLREGFEVVLNDQRFRLFLFAQWLGGVAAMALPFYVLHATRAGPDAAILLGAQTVGALLSNPLWGWWGDRAACTGRRAGPARPIPCGC